ncbi:MAG: hypothetical protein HRT38_18120 [Alteromonadaceae bacterium]|nr:hypothetical protein [Alteromonadaceae bacterium]
MKNFDDTFKVKAMIICFEIMVLIATINYFMNDDWLGILFSLGLLIIFIPTKDNIKFFQQKAFVKLKLNKVHMLGGTIILSSFVFWFFIKLN